MSYINNLDKEDIQNDTFSIIAYLISGATQGQINKDPYQVYEYLDAIYTLVWSKVKNEETLKKIDESFDDLSNVLFSVSPRDPVQLSIAFEQSKLLFRLMTKELKEMDLLFKTVVDYGEMVAK